MLLNNNANIRAEQRTCDREIILRAGGHEGAKGGGKPPLWGIGRKEERKKRKIKEREKGRRGDGAKWKPGGSQMGAVGETEGAK